MRKIILIYISAILLITVAAVAVLVILYIGGVAGLGMYSRRFLSILPLCLAAIIFAAFVLSRRMAARIAAPLNSLDVDSADISMYDELTPLAHNLARLRRETTARLAALQQRADTVQVITGHMKEGLILVDQKGMILSANNSALEIFGLLDASNKNLLQLCRDMKLWQKMRRCLNGAGTQMLFEREGRTYNIYLNPVYHGETTDGAIILFLDVTEIHQAEQQRKEFSANVSHELKTPLTTISALAEMIRGGMAHDEDIQGFAHKISVQARRLIDIIEDVIRLSEFDEGGLRNAFTSFSLCGLCGAVIAGLRDKALEKEVSLEIFDGSDIMLTANELMIDEMIYNLVENGIKYNVAGGSVRVSWRQEDSFTIITVADTGIGIMSEHLPRIFERFYRVDKSRSQKTGGTGLGLSIVKHIAEYHKGRVEIESVENVGTTINCFIRNQ